MFFNISIFLRVCWSSHFYFLFFIELNILIIQRFFQKLFFIVCIMFLLQENSAFFRYHSRSEISGWNNWILGAGLIPFLTHFEFFVIYNKLRNCQFIFMMPSLLPHWTGTNRKTSRKLVPKPFFCKEKLKGFLYNRITIEFM